MQRPSVRDSGVLDLPDRRGRRGRVLPYRGLLGALTLGAVAAARSLRAVEDLTAWLAAPFRRAVVIPGRISDTTLSETLAGLLQKDLRACLHRAVKAEHRRKGLEPTVIPFGVVAIDGKGVGKLDSWDHPDVQKVAPKGAPPYGLARTHRAHLVSSTATVCIDVRPIPGDTNEVGAVREFLQELVETYAKTSLFELVTADAGNCSEQVALGHCVPGPAVVISLAISWPSRAPRETSMRSPSRSSVAVLTKPPSTRPPSVFAESASPTGSTAYSSRGATSSGRTPGNSSAWSAL